jgi:type III secretion system YscQ/HrcQ family protein
LPDGALIGYTSGVSDVAPFPFARLPKISAGDCALLRTAARSLPLGLPTAALETLSALLGAPLRVKPALLETCPSGALSECLADPLVALIVETGTSPRAPRLAIELEPRFALCLVDRALGGTAGREIPTPLSPLDEVSRGVLAYLGARALHAAGASSTHRVRSVVTSPAALARAIGDAGSLVWPTLVTLGEDAGVVRAWLPETSLSAPRPLDARSNADALASLSITLVLEGGHAQLTATECASLTPGDVVVLDRASVRMVERRIAGTGVLRAAGASRTRWQVTIADGVARLEGRARNEERRMTQETTTAGRTSDAIALVGDAPIELRVELARVSVLLEDLAQLQPGEVVTTGRALGSEVLLRAGERVIATGELVDVDGELGVRVLRLGA